MFQLRQREDVHVETVDTPGVLEIRRVSAGGTRWTHRVDVVASYAERFTTPEVFPIDARFKRGDLHVIVHAFDATTRRLLPPRELSFLDGPRIDRTRPGADRIVLEPNEYVIAGDIHWQVTDESPTTFTLAGGRRVPKAEATGPFLRLVRYDAWHAAHDGALFVLDETADAFVLEIGRILKTDAQLIGPYGRLVILKGNLLRVAEERGDRYLVIAHGRLAAELGFTKYTYDSHSLGWAWRSPSELDAV